ncbi:MAG: thioredoxin [Candidatus Hadarchaeota archaeon]
MIEDEETSELDKICEKKLKEMKKKYFGKWEAIDKPLEVTDKTFDGTIEKYPVVVVDFWAPWCSPCLMVAPIIEELARDYAGKVVFGKVNVDENKEVAMRFGIMAIPTLLFFRGGKLVDQVVGALPEQQIEKSVQKLLG